MASEVVEEVKPHSYSLTPSGIGIQYFAPPQRRYEVAHIEGDPWKEVPSVTTVLDILNKPLAYWGMKVGVEGMLELHDRRILGERYVATSTMGEHRLWVTMSGNNDGELATVDNLTAALVDQKLTVNHQRDKAGDRGTAVHDAFELWAREGHLPNPEMFPEEERGYVEGLLAFIKDVNPEPLAAEVMVGSVEHGFAGRYDIRFQTSKECQVVHHRTPKRGAQYATLKPGSFLADLKTSSGIYPSHHLQLAAYELASVECGYEPTEAQGIIHVTADGNYEFVRSVGTPSDFLAILQGFSCLKNLEQRRKRK